VSFREKVFRAVNKERKVSERKYPRSETSDSRFVEGESEESEKENTESESSESESEVPPSHVRRLGAARCFASVASRESSVASVVRNEAPCDQRGDDYSDWLERRERTEEETTVLREGKVVNSCPMKRKVQSILTVGRNSRVIVASMGMFPPTPRPMRAQRKQRAPKFEGAAKIKPKTEAIKQVMLKHQRRPIISTRRPHMNAPTAVE